MRKTLEEMQEYLDDMSTELTDLMDFDMMEMYRYLTTAGNSLRAIDPADQVPANFVPGCTSNVYVCARMEDGVLSFTGSSEAHIVRGYLAILVEALSGLTVEDFLKGSRGPVEAFAVNTRIQAALTPSRANAFGNIYRLMHGHVEALSRS